VAQGALQLVAFALEQQRGRVQAIWNEIRVGEGDIANGEAELDAINDAVQKVWDVETWLVQSSEETLL
jgi:hypothetical protein